jgi:hypothetical protein
MSYTYILETAVVLVPISAVTSLVIANYKERVWLKTKKLEELVYRVEALGVALSDVFRSVYGVESASMRMNDRRAFSRVESKIVELKLQTKIYFPFAYPKLMKVLSAIATTYDALERVTTVKPEEAHAMAEYFDMAHANLKDSLELYQRDLIELHHRRGWWSLVSSLVVGQPKPLTMPVTELL